jgi:branched-chain amino acid transport system permease protein
MFSQLLVNGLVAGSGIALVALGFGLIYSTSRFFHFAHGGIYTLAAYVSYLLINWLNFPFVPALAFSVLLASLFGGLIEMAVYRPLRRKGASSIVLLLASLGLLIVIQNTISMIFGDSTKSIRQWAATEGLAVFGARITSLQIAIVGVSISICLLMCATLRLTLVGRMVRAVANDAQLGRVVGVDSDRMMLLALVFGSGLAAVAANLAALDTDIVPLMGFNALLMGVVAVIVGGTGSIPGILLGALLVGFAQHLGVWVLPTQWQDAVVFVVLIILLIFRPQGFLGRSPRGMSV